MQNWTQVAHPGGFDAILYCCFFFSFRCVVAAN